MPNTNSKTDRPDFRPVGSARRLCGVAIRVGLVVLLLSVSLMVVSKYRRRGILTRLHTRGVSMFFNLDGVAHYEAKRLHRDGGADALNYREGWRYYLSTDTQRGSRIFARFEKVEIAGAPGYMVDTDHFCIRKLWIVFSPDEGDYVAFGLAIPTANESEDVRLLALSPSKKDSIYFARLASRHDAFALCERTVAAHDWKKPFVPEPNTWKEMYTVDWEAEQITWEIIRRDPP